ncbi:MAG: UvrB/UvrC motif-containing protein [Phycisphaerales bacterium]
MSLDITRLLKDWPYKSGELTVRLIEGDDGEQRIQMRLDLGVLQMCVEGRPDGVRPRGYESLLDYHESRLDESEGRDPGPGVERGERIERGEFALTEEDCRELREEAVQYYHRYMALLVMDDFEGVVRDTSRNLRVLDLCGKHASTESDRQALEPFRAYITMMRARALASQALKDNEPKAAIHAIDEGLEALRRHFAENSEGSQSGPGGSFDQSQEVQLLKSMRESLVPKLPVSQRSELRKRLADALAAENYELAAILRDEIAGLKE